jgi:hypothetical protein
MPVTNYYDPDEALAFCDALLDDLDEVVRRYENDELPDGAEDFATSVKPKVEDMREWIDMNSRVTDGIVGALRNIRRGTDAWLERGR